MPAPTEAWVAWELAHGHGRSSGRGSAQARALAQRRCACVAAVERPKLFSLPVLTLLSSL